MKRNVETLSHLTLISASVLPAAFQEEYIKRTQLASSLFSFDFAGLAHSSDSEGYHRLLDDLAIGKEAAFLRIRYAEFRNLRLYLSEFARRHFMSVSAIERRERMLMSTELAKLIAPKPTFRSQKLCLLARAYIVSKLSYPNPPSNNMLRFNLYDISSDLGNSICSTCCYREDSPGRKQLSEHELRDCPLCPTPGNGLLVPKSKDIVNRFVRSLDPQQLALSQQGQRYWEDHYQHVCIRDKPSQVNLIWFSDHHIFDITVALPEKNGPISFGRPWLTAIFDAASDVLVGWIISVRPNKNTIAECFCRAAAFKMDSEIHALCEILYCDRGMDYRSNLIEGRDFELRQRLDTSMYLNRAFFDHPLLPALNVSVQHASAYRGRSKPCERLFGIFEKRYISQLPGWTGSSIDERPFDFSRELARLRRMEGVLSLEDFVRLWDEVIVPDYHNNPYENLSAPMDRYRSLPKANTLTPDWNTLAAFKTEKQKRRVHQNGIHYKNDVYWHPALADLVGKYVLICDFDSSFFHSISVLYDNKFVCEARPAIHFNMIESDKLKLKLHLAEQRSQLKKLTRRVSKIRHQLHASGLEAKRYMNSDLAPLENSELYEEPLLCYGPAIDFDADLEKATILSSEASDLGKIAVQRAREIERVLILSDDDPLDDYYAELGKNLLEIRPHQPKQEV